MSDINRVAGGHKANLSNPNTSEESKQHSRAQLDELEASGELTSAQDSGEKNPGNVIGGHKAAIKNPNVSEEAKEHSRAELRNAGALDKEYE